MEEILIGYTNRISIEHRYGSACTIFTVDKFVNDLAQARFELKIISGALFIFRLDDKDKTQKSVRHVTNNYRLQVD